MDNDPFFKSTKKKRAKRKAQSDDTDNGLLDDEPIKSRKIQHDDSDESDVETAAEKRLRLAKEYVKQLEEDEADKAIDDDNLRASVSARLKDEMMEARGTLKRQIAENLENHTIQLDKITRTKGHRLPVTCIALSSNKEFFISGSKDGSVIVWNSTTGLKVKKLLCKSAKAEKPSPVYAVALSSDNKFLAIGGKDKLVHVYNFQSYQLLRSFSGHRGIIYGLSFRRGSHDLMSASEDRTVKLWNLDEMTYVETLFGHQDAITSVCSLFKERAVTSGGRDNSVRLWKIPEESHLVFLGHRSPIDCVAMITEYQFVSGSEDGTLSLWDISKKKPTFKKRNAHGSNKWICSVGAVPFGDVVVSGSHDGQIKVWKIGPKFRSLDLIMEIEMNGFINGLQFSPDGTALLAGLGKEHRLGRWMSVNDAYNGCAFIPLDSSTLSLKPTEPDGDASSGDEEMNE